MINSVKEILSSEDFISKKIVVAGWVKTFRANRFISLNDGSTINNLQCVIDFKKYNDEFLKKISTGSAIEINGKVVESQGSKQSVEVLVDEIIILGESEPDEYPIQPKKHSLELDKRMSLFIEINTSNEPQKHGFYPDQKHEILECFDCGGHSVQGLMTVGPNTSNVQSIRHAFTTLRETKEWVEVETGRKIKHLSMGMSGDYEMAVEEGSTMIRVGSFLYGPRS